MAALEHSLEHESPPGGGLCLGPTSAPHGLGRWSGVKVTLWIGERMGVKPHRVTGWHYLCKLGYSEQIPRPSHPQAASKEEQVAFQKKS